MLTLHIQNFQSIKKFLLVPGFILVIYDAQSMTMQTYEHRASGYASGLGKTGLLIFNLRPVFATCYISLLPIVSLSSNPSDHGRFYFC